MRFVDLLDDKLIDLSVESKTKTDVIKSLISTVASHNAFLDKEEILEAVLDRERALSTGVGEGIAVPHAAISNLDKPIVAFGRVVDGVPFDSVDNKPVNLIFLLLAPEGEISLHLKILSRISRLCFDKKFRALLKAAQSPQDIISAISAIESARQEF
jgi:fructose-specific phosphotransferase system IIA component